MKKQYEVPVMEIEWFQPSKNLLVSETDYIPDTTDPDPFNDPQIFPE